MMQHNFVMGQKVRDSITGFEGIVTGTAQHITGCDTVAVNPGVGKDGNAREVHWFDWTRLELVDANPITLPGRTASDPTPASQLGGPQDHPRTN